jgi:hypothetical protein
MDLKGFHQLGENRFRFDLWRSLWTSEQAREIYDERFPQRMLSNARTLVNVGQHLRDFGCFEMNERDLGRQREDGVSVAEEEILHEIENQHE